MGNQEKFTIRPGYGSKDLLIEFQGDHRSPGYPNIIIILQSALHARQKPSTLLNLSDHFITSWEYANGEYEIDDDWGGCFITAPVDNRQVIRDVAQALLASGLFEKKYVPFSRYK